jgi:hypothetical protein
MTEVWRQDPPEADPPGRRGKYDWVSITAELKERPGEWRLVDDNANRGLATAIKRRKMTALQDPNWTFDVMTRKNDREAGTAEVWMSAVPRNGEEN